MRTFVVSALLGLGLVSSRFASAQGAPAGGPVAPASSASVDGGQEAANAVSAPVENGARPASSVDAAPAAPTLAAPAPKAGAVAVPVPAPTPPDSAPTSKEPFAFGDFTWLNGNDRRHKALLETPYFTGSFMLDVNYSYSFARPIDNTIVGSTAVARHNEVELGFLGFGGDFHYKNARARLITQFGTRSTVVPRNDFSTTKGQFELANVYRYLAEANAGYHIDALSGINIDVGMFMSYVGLFSYYNAENWAYQPSFTSDNTPWFFNGARIQVFVSDKLKIEPWIINGWQTYGKFNEMPGFGGQILWRPKEWISVLSNNYVGFDTANRPGRVRFHTDNSLQVRYFNDPTSFLDRAAFSLTQDFGFEDGGGVTAFGGDGGPAQHFISGMAYHRTWFWKNKLGWTFGGGYIQNPGRYLVLLPTGEAQKKFDTSAGTKFSGWDASTTFDFMPDDYQTWRLELVHRRASVPYFAGHGGVTSPDGYSTTPVPDGWEPDQKKSETRIIAALLFRL